MTSRDLANRIQRRLRRESENRKLKVGHTGTLDPLAQGLVVLSVGAATRLTPWMLKPTKRYTATFRLGAYSESGDLEEPVVELPNPTIPSRHDIEKSTRQFLGWIDQTPPTHSAIWVDGQRAHERIRRGEDVDMPTRRVWIGRLDVLHYEYPLLEVDVLCGSGTYLRSLGMDIGTACQTAAVMTDLTRTAVGNFELHSAISCIPPNDPPPVAGMPLRYQLTPMHDLIKPNSSTGTSPPSHSWQGESPWLCDYVRPPLVALDHMPQLKLDADDAQRVRHGMLISGEAAPPISDNVPPPDVQTMQTNSVDSNITEPNLADVSRETPPITIPEMITTDPGGDLVAVMRRKRNQWAPYRVFASMANQRVH